MSWPNAASSSKPRLRARLSGRASSIAGGSGRFHKAHQRRCAECLGQQARCRRRRDRCARRGQFSEELAERAGAEGKVWSGRRDLNPRPLVSQTSALTGLRHAPTGTARTIGMRPWPRNNMRQRLFISSCTAELTDFARLLAVFCIRAPIIEKRPWLKLFQHDLTRILVPIHWPLGARKHGRRLRFRTMFVSASMTIWRRSRKIGAPLSRTPTAPYSKVSTGSPPGSGILACATTSCPPS